MGAEFSSVSKWRETEVMFPAEPSEKSGRKENCVLDTVGAANGKKRSPEIALAETESPGWSTMFPNFRRPASEDGRVWMMRELREELPVVMKSSVEKEKTS